jgi:hypothetical protein
MSERPLAFTIFYDEDGNPIYVHKQMFPWHKYLHFKGKAKE